MKFLKIPVFLLLILIAQSSLAQKDIKSLKEQIINNSDYDKVEGMALDIVKTGFNAGDGYNQVWARDLNTFIKYSCRILPRETIRDALLRFFYFQGFDGNMVGGYEEVPPGFKADNYAVYESIRENVRNYLWDDKNNKFIPHIYIRCKEFAGIDESEIYYHGGTIVAIEAGVLDKDEVGESLRIMRANVKAAGAMSVGLTMYPPCPDGSFENKGMGAYQYQNGGDWTWFGARLIPGLVRYGFVEEAIAELEPFIKRVIENDGFYEWYTISGEPRGSGTFRGSAGVLLEAIEKLREL
ncbi:MAG: hypothetical protein RQ743_07460 [Bacteroidales bacterium]|nr:hypothetical protein [Bacteroidales bacterium]